MRVLLFDPFHGAAGDMIVGALLHLGADREQVIRAMSSLVREPTVTETYRCGILAVQVLTNAGREERTLAEVLERVSQADAPERAIELAKKVFFRMETAERNVHGNSMVHFHEVGADDAIAEVIGACTALVTLNIRGVLVRPVSLGGGTVSSAHGAIPVPAPATVLLLRDAGIQVVFGSPDEGELCTPTGAALLAEFSAMAPDTGGGVRISAVGYGAGERDPSTSPNVLRAYILEKEELPTCDTVDLLETNVDDVSGEVLAFTLSRLMEAGARDASAIPCMMKKGRPGFLVRVISTPDLSLKLSTLMAQELGTLGIRCLPSVHRFIADRTIERVEVEIAGRSHVIPIRCGWIGESCYTLKAEFEASREFAEELGLPVREVSRLAEERGWKLLRDRGGTRSHGQ